MTQKPKKEQRSNKWTFLFYKESAPEDYLNILEELHIPFVLSPWHDRDVNRSTGEFKKSHKHGAFFFDSLKSYSQVSDLISDKLNGPAHVEVVMSPKGMYDYFTHAENPEKTPYNVEDIESGAGFELDKFLAENNPDLLLQVYEIMRDSELKEFADFTDLIAQEHPDLLFYVFEKSYFFKIYLDSKRYNFAKEVKDESDE
ncbi:Replication protein RepB [Lactococcus cremoris]|uniref:Replication protein n=1 Tax=Lactococcus lactis subsp. cremoris TaxID=1359 RepID=A0AA34XLQ4_LACLC|nr:replication protein [Lactococcus cremoris]ARE24329.1 replication protein [Lactococcus cremoris]KZK50105.1 Replication protein [Lactococcus cremoris]MCT4420806.1 Replication protein RepB [Lactococcus cremoris]MCT4423087.1 Replication protein RepB [Lactococcus cremoris]MCT4425276.1 Replication protein RepB [Lactococcus cremoris]